MDYKTLTKIFTENPEHMELGDYIGLMHRNTDENGILYIPGWYYFDEKEHYLKCEIKWNIEECHKTIHECRELNKKAKMIAEVCKKVGDNGSEIKKFLPDNELYEVWETYFDTSKYGENDYEKRVGNNIAAGDQVMRFRRLCKLYEIGAPEVIVNSEACMFAAAYTVHKYGKKIEKVC